MKKISAIILLLANMVFSSCGDFLDETMNKSGNAYIYHMDQLYGLLGGIDLYMFGSVFEWDGINYYNPNLYMQEQGALTDAVEYSPEYYLYGLLASDRDTYERYCWQNDAFVKKASKTWTWEPVWERIYRFNTVLENLDKVVQSTEVIRHQVEGEARFGRAYYHFMLLTQYALWDDEKPGIGYRDDTKEGVAPERKTVAYTLGRIYEDLDLAEAALTEAGRTAFDQERNFRPTVPTVQAFRARVALYRGDYDLALSNATNALKAHNTLVDFKASPEYELSTSMEIHFLDETDTKVKEVVTLYEMTDLLYGLGYEAIAKYEELYLPNTMMNAHYPISESFYRLWDRDNDARWKFFYSACNPLTMAYVLETKEVEGELLDCILHEDQAWLKPWNMCGYSRFNDLVFGMTTAEMYLIKAECEARGGDAGMAAETLKTLRYTRFMDAASAEAGISGSVQDVLDERLRELGAVWRFYDIKRLNGAENAGISVSREILSNPADINSRTQLQINPDDPRWALPFNVVEAELMGWQQNEGWK